MNFKINTRGFTLIELLVVIAIIGILASVVLASLNQAREKGRDASARASMGSLRAQAELGVDQAGTYLADLCTVAGTTQGGLGTLIAAANAQVPAAGAATCIQNAAAGSRAQGWAAVITLTDGTFYCTDSSGFGGGVTARNVIAAASAAGADVRCN